MAETIEFNAIAAICDDNNGIGKDNKLPWKISEDYHYYLRVINTIINKGKINAVILEEKLEKIYQKKRYQEINVLNLFYPNKK